MHINRYKAPVPVVSVYGEIRTIRIQGNIVDVCTPSQFRKAFYAVYGKDCGFGLAYGYREVTEKWPTEESAIQHILGQLPDKFLKVSKTEDGIVAYTSAQGSSDGQPAFIVTKGKADYWYPGTCVMLTQHLYEFEKTTRVY